MGETIVGRLVEMEVGLLVFSSDVTMVGKRACMLGALGGRVVGWRLGCLLGCPVGCVVAEWAEMMVEWKALSWVAMTAAQLVTAMAWKGESERLAGRLLGWSAAGQPRWPGSWLR